MLLELVAKDVGPLATKMWNWMNTGGMQEILEARRGGRIEKSESLGFFDMNGLVQEWCADHWVKSYVSGRQQHPLVVTDARTYVVRGGAWFTESDSTRCGARSFADQNKRSDGLGMRLVWEPLDNQPTPTN